MVMEKKKIFFTKLFYLVLFCAFYFNSKIIAQPFTNRGVVVNEYCVSNDGTYIDGYGKAGDWVELLNVHTQTLNLANWGLSDDKTNLFKWKFPNTFTLAVNGFGVIWLDGKNKTLTTLGGPEHHANFDITQCKSEWLILTHLDGTIRDSIAIKRTSYGHTRIRELGSYSQMGFHLWRVSTANTFMLANPTNTLSYKDYMPTPVFSVTPNTQFGLVGNAGEVQILVGGLIADSTGQCFEVRYENGTSQFPNNTTSPVYTGTNSPIFLNPNTTNIRAVTYPRAQYTGTNPIVLSECLQDQYLPSFCETNTYFQDNEHNAFNPQFGLIAVTMSSLEATSFFPSNGSVPPPPTGTVHVEYFDNKNQWVDAYGVISKPINEPWKTKQKGYYITIDDRRGMGCEWQGKIFNVAGLGTSNRSSFPTLHLKGGDVESHSYPNSGPSATPEGTGIRDVFVQSLAAKNNLNVSPLHIKPVVAMTNGTYTGVYNLTEIYDKYYENYYYKQSLDSLDLNFVNSSIEGSISYPYIDGSTSSFMNNWASTYTMGVNGTMSNLNPTASNGYYALMNRIDKKSMLDYMILNSYCINNNIWTYNVAFAKGAQNVGQYGNKWHYYLWNVPTVFNYTTVTANPVAYVNPYMNICLPHVPLTPTINILPQKFNGHGNIFDNLLRRVPSFKLEYLNRYQDLINGPLSCTEIMKHYDYIYNLYSKEMKYHEDPASTPTPGEFATIMDAWDSNMVAFKRILQKRCDYVKGYGFSSVGTCTTIYGPQLGPFAVSVDVEPEGAGVVRLNSLILPNYKWTNSIYGTTLPIKAIPTSTDYAFHHWEFKNNPQVNNSIADSVNFSVTSLGEEIIAVFTNKLTDLSQYGEAANIPNAFSPNGDNVNDEFRPLGSSEFSSNYDLRIYNRWGQEVFRSTDPKQGWNGMFGGKEAQSGVYAYVVNYTNAANEAKMAKGNVTLLR